MQIRHAERRFGLPWTDCLVPLAVVTPGLWWTVCVVSLAG
jgi:hypothetical protein